MITIVEQSTSERKQETKELFERIRPHLDEGYSYNNALILIGYVSKNVNLDRFHGWYRDLTEYGASQGYPFGEHSYVKADKVGVVKTKAWDHLW